MDSTVMLSDAVLSMLSRCIINTFLAYLSPHSGVRLCPFTRIRTHWPKQMDKVRHIGTAHVLSAKLLIARSQWSSVRPELLALGQG